MVAPGAGTAGPVLLACREWDPHGLARRLPSPGAAAWRYAPLLHWQVQCPGCVCAVLAAGSGGLGPMPGVMSSLFSTARPAFTALRVAGRPVWVSLILSRWYAIPCGLCISRARSGCPSGFPRVSFVCVCARALAASAPPPLPGLVWRAHLARSWCWALLGRFHSVRAPPRARPRSSALFGLLGGERAGPVSPCLAWGCALPVGLVRAWAPVTKPSARALASWPCALAWRAVGAARKRPGGAPVAWVRGARGRALSHPRPLVLSGVRPGPTTHWLWVRGVQAWGPVTNPTACDLASWLCALWERHKGARRGRLLPVCGVSGDGRSPTPDLSSVPACGRGPLPTGCGCAGCGHRDPSPTPQRALLRAGFARSRGGMRMPGGGASCLGVGCPGSGALPTPTTRPFGRAAGAHYPLAVGAGGAGVGTRHQPHSARSGELALRAVRAAQGRPGGAPLAWVWGVWGRALSHSRPLVRSGVRRGPTHYPLAVGAGGAGVVTRHQPHSARSCVLWGWHEGARRGRLLPGCGASGVERSPTPDHSSFQACGRGPYPPAVGAGVLAWGPVTNPTARALASWLCAL